MMLLGSRNGMLSNRITYPSVKWFYFEAKSLKATIKMEAVGSPDTASIEYSIDNCKTWRPFDCDTGTTVVTLKQFHRAYFRAAQPKNIRLSINDTNRRTFAGTGELSCGGNILTLLIPDESANSFGQDFVSSTSSGILSNLFRGMTSLTSARDLRFPSDTLTQCYCYLFAYCTSLIEAPEITPEILEEYACYMMFDGCTSLVNAPEIHAITAKSYSCRNMFSGCTSLTYCPDLRAITLGSYAYETMFAGCTSLVNPPNLSATSIGTYACRYMFQDCTSLVSAPNLPATTLNTQCYFNMFNGCTSLVSVTKLPATTLASRCYQGMFTGCTALKTAPELPATTLTTACYRAMFDGCTSLENAPMLPAQTLISQCYMEMFKNCTSLTISPVLIVKSITYNSYVRMFQGCSSLSKAIVLLSEFPSTTSYTLDWFDGVSATGTFVCPTSLGDDSTILRGTTYCPNGWTVSHELSEEYVKSGLTHMWDGENNSAIGHDPSSTTWKDLVGSMDLTLDGTSHFGINYMQTTDERSGANSNALLSCEHIECMFEITSIPNYWYTVFSNVNGVWYWGNGEPDGEIADLYFDRYFSVYRGPEIVSMSHPIEGDLYYNNVKIDKQGTGPSDEGVGPFRIFGGADWEDDPDTYKGLIGKCYCVRTYSRILSDSERIINYAIDIARQTSLPYDAEVEYLQSDGNQWVDSGIICDTDVGFNADFSITSISNGYSQPIGTQNLTGYRGFVVENQVDGTFAIDAGTEVLDLYVAGIPYEERVNVQLLYKNNGLILITRQNGQTYSENTSSQVPIDNSIGIFALHDGDAFYDSASMKFYGMKISKGNNVVANLYPVRVGSVGYVYDSVSKKLLGNLGTGTFSIGPDKA